LGILLFRYMLKRAGFVSTRSMRKQYAQQKLCL